MLPKKELSLFDSTCLIVGIIIGAGIYQMAPDIAKGAGSISGIFLIWIVGGLLSLFGALGYAELATAYPKEGGDYIYLTKAYGKWAGFLFGWVQLAVVRPGDIVVVAFAFAMYAKEIYNPWPDPITGQIIYATLAISTLTLINVIGVRESKWTQNILTIVKALGLIAILLIALTTSSPAGQTDTTPIEFEFPSASVAMIMVLFTFGGWNEMAYVAAEVKNPKRNIVRALVTGTVAVTVLYLLANVAFLYTLGYNGMAQSSAVAADTVSARLPNIGGQLISALICISALGAVNGLIFTGARISYAVGADHRVFKPLGKWSSVTETPARALLLQGGIALTLVVLLGSFTQALLYTAAAVYSFYLATSLAVIILRHKEPQTERPYKVTGYPVTTVIFCAVCAFLIYSSITYSYSKLGPEVAQRLIEIAPSLTDKFNPEICGYVVASLPYVLLLAGLPLYWLTTGKKSTLENLPTND
ncbi:MAG: amino acid permease [Planctomycetes bacterium]|nr:amino acid permease [Planctomycetota bacterium]